VAGTELKSNQSQGGHKCKSYIWSCKSFSFYLSTLDVLPTLLLHLHWGKSHTECWKMGKSMCGNSSIWYSVRRLLPTAKTPSKTPPVRLLLSLFLINFCQLAVSLGQKSARPRPYGPHIPNLHGRAEIMRIVFPVRDTVRQTREGFWVGELGDF